MSDVSELSGAELARLGSAIITDTPDAIVYADSEGIIRFWNSGAERLFGFAKENALGQSLDIIIPKRLRERHWDGYRHMMATGHSRHAADELLSVPAQTKQGDTLSVQFTVAPIRNNDGRLAGIVAVLRDATPTFRELKRLRAEVSHRSSG